MENKKITVASLFAGIGGICKAFQNVGAELLWANEFDKNACITYRENFSHNLIEDDIHNLTKKENIDKLEKVDIITSGFPCQAFSIAGYQRGFDDPRGNLFFETAKIIDKLQPKAFLLENVKNLVSHDSGRTFNVIKNIIINDLKYSFIPFILNSKDYGNIPQTRERIYIVGFINESQYNNFGNFFDVYSIKEDKIYRELKKISKKSDILTLNFTIPKPMKLTKTIHDILDSDKQDDSFYYKKSSQYYPELVENITSKDTVYQLRRVYIRENKTNLCPTLTANMGMGGHNVPLIKDDYGIRKLTPIECSRFQGFDDIKFPNIAKSHQYKQLGNSVTVKVIERIAQEIIKTINGD